MKIRNQKMSAQFIYYTFEEHTNVYIREEVTYLEIKYLRGASPVHTAA